MSEFSDFLEPESSGSEFSEFLDAPATPAFREEKPTWAYAAAKEMADMFMGIGHLGETALIQGTNFFPEQPENSTLGFLQRLAPERAAQDWEALKKAPAAAVRSLGETFLGLVPGSDYSIYDKLKHAPIQTVSDLMTPFSMISGVGKTGAKVAGIAGKGELAKTLTVASEAVAPTGIVKAAGAGAREIPGVGTVLKNLDVALDAQRWTRRERSLADNYSQDQMVGLETHFKDVPAHERDIVIDLVEGTYGENARGVRPRQGKVTPGQPELGPAQGLSTPLAAVNEVHQRTTGHPLVSNETRALIEEYRTMIQARQMKTAAVLSSGDEALYMNIMDRFENARFKPLAEKTSYELGVQVTAPQAKRLWEEGLIGSHELNPIYFPHIRDLKRAEHADGLVKSLEPYWHSSMKVRSGNPDYDRDFLRAVATRERSLNRWLGNYNATMSVVNTQGVPLYGLRTERELIDTLADLKVKNGIDYVYFAPELYKHLLNGQAKATSRIVEAMAQPGKMLDEALKDGLRGAIGEFGDEYQSGLLAIIDDMKKTPEDWRVYFGEGNKALPPGPTTPPGPTYGTPGGPPPGRAKLYAIPKASAKRMLAEMGGMPDGMRAFGMASDIWRAMVLPLNLGWNTMNAGGNAILATLSGSFNPKFRLKIKDYLLPDLQTAGIVGESKLLDDLSKADRAKISVAGLPVGEWYNKIGETLPGRFVASVVEKGYKLNEIVDTFARESVAAGAAKSQAIKELRMEGIGGLLLDPKLIEKRAIDIVSDPIRAQKVTDFVNHFMGNYFDLTPWERTWLRNFAFPFWSWWKSMAKLSTSLPIQYPGRTQVLQMLEAARADADDDPLRPPELRDRLPLGPGSKGGTKMASTRAMLPMIQAVEGLPSFSPILGALYMAGTGQTTYGQDIVPEGYESVGGRLFAGGSPGVFPRAVSRGEESVVNAFSALRETIRGLPQIRFTETMLKGEAARPGESFFGGSRENPAAPFTSHQSRWDALASQLGVQIKEFNDPLAKARGAKRLVQAYLQSIKRSVVKKSDKPAIQDPEDEIQELLERLK